MRLWEAIDELSDDEIIDRLFELYPNDPNDKDTYEEVLREIRSLEGILTDFTIMLVMFEEDGREYVDVGGYLPDSDEVYAIELTDWREWVVMPIDSTTLSTFDLVDIVAHCIYEMSFIGFTNSEVQGELARLRDMVKDLSLDDSYDGTAPWDSYD